MQPTKKILLATMLTILSCYSYAQDKPDYMLPPNKNEKVLGIISMTTGEFGSPGASNLQLYQKLLEKASKDYPDKIVDIRDMKTDRHAVHYGSGIYNYYYGLTCKVVYSPSPEEQTRENLSSAFNKALRNVREGSRLAIDQVSVVSGMDKSSFKDQIIDYLLDNGYKVIAKDYLEKLYEEQQNQQSGVYNDRTTVQENNFSAVGYYINVKVTETSLRVQVVNVSTGEYEGNATINF